MHCFCYLYSIVNTKSYLPLEINQLLTIMGSQIRHEVTSKNKSLTNGASMDNSGGASGAAASSRSGDSGNSVGSDGHGGFGVSNSNNAFAGSNCLWRGLQIYDADLHTVCCTYFEHAKKLYLINFQCFCLSYRMCPNCRTCCCNSTLATPTPSLLWRN